MGSLRSIFERLPGMGDVLNQIPPEALDDRELTKVKAMIQSMTNAERNNPDILDESRFGRIARGSGRDIQEVRDLYERFLQVRSMMGQLGQRVRTELDRRKKRAISVTQIERNFGISTSEGRPFLEAEL